MVVTSNREERARARPRQTAPSARRGCFCASSRTFTSYRKAAIIPEALKDEGYHREAASALWFRRRGDTAAGTRAAPAGRERRLQRPARTAREGTAAHDEVSVFVGDDGFGRRGLAR